MGEDRGAPPPLSVVLPVHNGMPYLEASVRSILAQSWRDFELVIGDDGSTDGSSALIAALAAEDARIRPLRRERPSGLAVSANWVVGAARAPLVAIAHADDLSYPDRLARQMAVMTANPDAVLCGTLADAVDEAGRIVRPADYWRLLMRSPFAPFPHSSCLLRRAAFDAVGGYRPEAEYWEDLDLYYRLAALGRVLVVAEPLTTVRHATVSTRLRHRAEAVENSVDLMFRSAKAHARGLDHGALLAAAARERPRRVHPKTFVSRGSTLMWSGRSPHMLRRMLARGRFEADWASLYALGWVAWGSASPRSLRLFLRTLLRLRNRIARSLLKSRDYVEWHSRRSPQAAPRQPGEAATLSPAPLPRARR
jgi:glycosyltransferase involved in cell wall biosynthesis